MPKLNTKKAAGAVAKAAAPIVAAAILSRLTTGRVDLKRLLLDAAEGAIRSAKTAHARPPVVTAGDIELRIDAAETRLANLSAAVTAEVRQGTVR